MIFRVFNVFSLVLLLSPSFGLAAPVKQEDGAFEVLCRSLPVYQKSEDVEYKAGVDVHGQPVVPADVTPQVPVMPDIVEIPVTVDLVAHFSALNIPLPQGVELKPEIGILVVYQDGHVQYNGQDITAQSYAVCAKPQKIMTPDDRQDAPDVVNSLKNKETLK